MFERHTALARDLRRHQTPAEALLWRELRGRRLEGFKFRRQMPLAGYIVDFACIEARLTIELDGEAHRDRAELDRMRREAIHGLGWHEVRFTNAHVLERPSWVIDEIVAILRIARNRP